MPAGRSTVASSRRLQGFGLGLVVAAVVATGLSGTSETEAPAHACPGEAFPRGGSAGLIHQGGTASLSLEARALLAHARARTVPPLPGDS